MTTAAAGDRARGVVLVNVLVVIAIAAALLLSLSGRQDAALERARVGAAAAQVRALLAAAETSVLVALARDLQEAPEADHFAEPWTAAVQEEAELANGRFSVRVVDLRGRFDLNRLTRPNLQDAATFRALLAALELPSPLGDRIVTALSGADGLRSPDDLLELGATPRALDRLAPFVTALPLPALVNLNTAGEVLVAAMLGNPIDARRLIQMRDRQGYVTRADLERLRIVIPPNAGFASDMFEVTTRAEVDGTETTMTSRIQRTNPNQRGIVQVVERRIGPPALPPLPRPDALFVR